MVSNSSIGRDDRRAPARPGGRAASWRALRCGGTDHAGGPRWAGLLTPPVEGPEVEHDVPGESWVCEPEPGTWAVLAERSHIHHLTIGRVGGEGSTG